MPLQERKREHGAHPPFEQHIEAPVEAPRPAPGPLSPAHVIALQRSSGNTAVTRLLRAGGPQLQRAPDPDAPKQPDELLVHVLRGAAFRAHEARLSISAKDMAAGAKRFSSERADLIAQIDEALLLAAKTPASQNAFRAADSLFGSATQLVALGESRGLEGIAGLQEKLAELRASLQKRGYRYPADKIKAGKTEEPRERAKGDLMRAARLGFAAARAELQAGQKKLAADRKAGREPTLLHGAQEAAVHLKVASLQLLDMYQLDHDQLRVLVRDLDSLGELTLGMLREGAQLPGAKPLWDQINVVNKYVGLDPLMPFGTPTATSAQEAKAEQEGRSRARAGITKFERAYTDFANADRRWEESNFIDYLTKTSSNPRLSWGHSTAFGIFAEALSSAAGTGVMKYLRHRSAKAAAAGATGAAVGAAIGNAPGAAAGFVIGVLVEYAVTFLLDHLTGKSDLEARAAAAAVAANNKLIQAQLTKLDEKQTAENNATRAAANHLTARVDKTSDPKELGSIADDVEESAASAGTGPSVSDRSLMTKFLKAWVLQHAGDEDEANTETSDDQWTEARTIAFGKGRSLDNHPEIFAHQTLAHWEDLGLPGIAHAQPMIKEAEAAGSNGADSMMKAYDDKTFTFTNGTKKPDAFIKFVEKGEGRRLTDEGKQAIRENRFKLTATFDLHEYKGAVYIDNWEYELKLIGPSMTQWWEMAKSGRSATAGAINSSESRESTVEFDVNPDDD